MSADQLAAAAIGAGVATLVCVFLMLLIVASVYQGAHASRSGPRRDGRRAARYHRLAPAERRIWRHTPPQGLPVTPAGSWAPQEPGEASRA